MAATNPAKHLVKRYANRKLYDVEAKAYVSMADLAALIRGGHTLEVVDNVTGEDITAQIRRAWQIALTRDPSSDEVGDAMPAVQKHGLAVLCRALFNSNEFLFMP